MHISDWQLRRANETLEAGGIIAYPTETVYGLGCDPDDEVAVIELLLLKQRPLEKGLILIASDFNQLQDYIQPLTSEQLERCEEHWPGPVTLVLPVAEEVSPLLTGGRDTIAVRVSEHPVVRSLCDTFGGPIVSTSANISRLKPARHAYEVHWQLPEVDYVMAGHCDPKARPSRIIDVTSGDVLR